MELEYRLRPLPAGIAPTDNRAVYDALLPAKLFLPSARPDWVVRLRLLDQLAAPGQTRLILVCAPAGYGKTTLVAVVPALGEVGAMVFGLSQIIWFAWLGIIMLCRPAVTVESVGRLVPQQGAAD